MKSLGLDLHAANYTLAVLKENGQMISCLTYPTSAQQLISSVQAIPGPKTLIVEESHLAEWAKRTLEPYVDKLIICDPKRNRWIAADEFNNDDTSALKLAKLHQGGFLKEVIHPDQAGAKLRGLFLHYFDLTAQLVRFKNKLKATFRREAIPTAGKGIYEVEQREEWLKQLKAQKHIEHAAKQRFEIVEILETQKAATRTLMVKLARQERAYKLLSTIPGVGPVIATGYQALIDTPYRFSRKSKLWKYGGFSNKLQTSDNVIYSQGVSKSGNRVLKWLVVEHFQAAVLRSKDGNRFQRQYQALRKRGLDETAARRQVCRSILSVVRAVWLKEEDYRDNPLS